MSGDKCSRCASQGWRFDAICLASTCAHVGPELTSQEKKDRKPRARVMACPPRSCSCKAGQRHRQMLRDRAEKDEAAYQEAERVRMQSCNYATEVRR